MTSSPTAGPLGRVLRGIILRASETDAHGVTKFEIKNQDTGAVHNISARNVIKVVG